jgi:predicted signal transduction protein with EAL and GGDEF domain
VLIGGARRIAGITRAGDLLARLGGDEFVLVCPALDEAAAEIVAAKVLTTLDALFVIGGEEFQLGASVGIAVGPRDGARAEDLLQHADAAMYQAKRGGRDSFALYSDDAGASRRKLTLSARLRRAIERDELLLHYQPVHELHGSSIRGVEALLRWDDPAHGLTAPAEFLPLAEDTGLIGLIGEWVLERACAQASDWRSLGLTPRIGINASARELRDPGYAGRVAATLARHPITPDQLLIELSESAMGESARSQAVIEQLHALGVRLALDDFGTEASSLARLRVLPVQVLKVDRSFVRDLPHDFASAAIVRAIATLGAGLDMDVVAEGVESAAQLRFVAEAGCGFGQGYLLSRPQCAASATALLTSSSAQSRRAGRAPALSPAARRR